VDAVWGAGEIQQAPAWRSPAALASHNLGHVLATICTRQPANGPSEQRVPPADAGEAPRLSASSCTAERTATTSKTTPRVSSRVPAGPRPETRCSPRPVGYLNLHHDGGTPSLPPARPTGVATVAAAPEQTVLTNRIQVVARAQ
jgi:hypothetical protein